MKLSEVIRVVAHARLAAGLSALLILTLLASDSPAQPVEIGTTPERPLVLNLDSLLQGTVAAPSDWRFHSGDDTRFADPTLDDSDWEMVPTSLNQVPDRWTGFGWFRLHVEIDSSLHQRPIGIEIYHQGASEVYLGGRLVGGVGRPHQDADSLQTRLARLALPVAVSAGTNVIAVRYAAPPSEMGGIFGRGFTVGFVEMRQHTEAVIAETRVLTGIQFFFVALFAAFALLHLAMFSFHRASSEHLWFGLFAVVTAVLAFWMMQFVFVESAQEQLARLKLMTALLPAFGLLFQRFTYALFYERLPRLFYVFLVVGVGVAVWVIVEPQRFLLLFGFVMLVCLEVVRATVLALWRGRPGARVLGFGLGVLALATVLSLLAEAQILPVIDLVQAVNPITGATVLVVAMSIHLSRKVARTNRDLELQLDEVRRLSAEQLEKEREVRKERIRAERIGAENRRRAQELEEARQLQLSMLPRELPQRPDVALDAYLRAATEVGGDYYDVAVSPEGTLTVAVGDATGHGMRAGTVVTAAKSLFWTLAGVEPLDGFITRASSALRQMGFPGLYMGLIVARWNGRTLELTSAGMPPVHIWRHASKRIETVFMKALPLGGPEFPYERREVTLDPGDVVLLMSDGFPERFNAAREELGYEEAARAFEKAAAADPNRVIEQLVEAADSWADGTPPNDDMTFLTLRLKGEGERRPTP